MTTVVDFDALQGPEILLLGNTKVSRERTGGGFSGFSAVDSILVTAQVSNVRGVRQPSITVRVDGSEDGLSWSEVCSFDFTASGVQKQLVSSPTDQLRVVSVPGGGLHEAVVLSVVAVPETINTRNGNGGSQPALVKLNGLYADYDPAAGIDALAAIIFDPAPQDWESQRSYSLGALPNTIGRGVGAFVRASSDPALVFSAQPLAGTSAALEPTWSTDGSTHVVDGEVDWTPNPYKGAWSSGTAYSTSDVIVANGDAWGVNNEGGTSGGSEPTWGTVSDYGGTIADNDLVWIRVGVAATWQADHRYEIIVQQDHGNFWPRWVLPTTPGDWIFASELFLKRFAVSGATEPDWASADDLHPTYADGEILWSKDTGTPALVLTGLVAPRDTALITVGSLSDAVFLIDETNVVSTYGADVAPAVGNGFDGGGGDKELDSGYTTTAVYDGAAWRLTAPLT